MDSKTNLFLELLKWQERLTKKGWKVVGIINMGLEE